MVSELVRPAVYILDFTKLITQTLPVTNTYNKNWSFAAKFVRKRTLRHKLRQEGPVPYSPEKLVLCRRVLKHILHKKNSDKQDLSRRAMTKGSCVAKF